MLKLQDVTLRYRKNQVLKGLNLEIYENELCGIVGPEGSGKSSVCKVSAGLVLPQSGSVLFNGKPLKQEREYRYDIGYLPQNIGMYEYQQVREYLLFFAEIYQMKGAKAKERVDEILEYVGMEQSVEEYVSKLTRGPKQKLGIARALLHNPNLLILDDILASLDPVSKVEIQTILQKLHEEGRTILITSDSLENAQKICTKIAVMDAGQIVSEGTVEEITRFRQCSNPIRIQVRDRVDDAMRYLWSHPLVSSITRKENDVSISFDGEGGEEAELLREMIALGIPINSFHREESDFDSLFLAITKR